MATEILKTSFILENFIFRRQMLKRRYMFKVEEIVLISNISRFVRAHHSMPTNMAFRSYIHFFNEYEDYQHDQVGVSKFVACFTGHPVGKEAKLKFHQLLLPLLLPS